MKMLQALDSSAARNNGRDAIQAFATMHRLKTRIDEDGTKIIPGKFGHIYEHDENRLGVLIMPDPPRPRYWGHTRASLVTLGLVVVQDGDSEGAAIFDPNNRLQVEAASRAAGVKRKRAISSEQREQQIERLRASAGKALSAVETRRDAEPVAAAVASGTVHPSTVSWTFGGRRASGGGISK
jgi:hypothetical protein